MNRPLIALAGVLAAAVLLLVTEHNDTKPGPVAEQRKDWGWTSASEARTKQIFAADGVAQSFFAHRRVMIETTGPWNDTRGRRVLGGVLKVSVSKPIRGIHRIPGFVSIQSGRFKLFRVDVAGARKFHVIVSFERGRVAEISPLAEGSPRARG
jgi:hypothetical protein